MYKQKEIKMSKVIKNNLFKFVTLRNLQLIAEEDKDIGFVYHPGKKDSVFYGAIDGVEEKDRAEKLKTASDTFSPMAIRADVKKVNENLYSFASWLMRNKNALTYESIHANKEGVLELSSSDELVVWDNLLYQTINSTSVSVREALIKMLVANKFLAAFNKFSFGQPANLVFTEEQDKEFTRRAHASVVISKDLFPSSSNTSNEKASVTTEEQRLIDNALDVELAKARIKAYDTLVEELKDAEVIFNKNNEKDYEKQLDSHVAEVEKLIEEAVPVKVEIKDNQGILREIDTYPDLNLPKFEFTRQEPITETYLTGKISDDSLGVFKTSGLDVYDEFSEVIAAINVMRKADNQIVLNKSPKAAKKIDLGGVVVRLHDREATDFVYDYNIPSLMEVTPSGLARPFMMLLDGTLATDVADMSYTITFDDNSTASATGFIAGHTANMLKLFPAGVAFPANTETYTIEGTITLHSGEELGFDQLVDTTSRQNMGDFIRVVNGGTQDDDDHIFGVTNLGIADFRRVDQEVCCYVPGEVSHIENVMAREYKERSSRSLTSSETTVERTEETERENLNDTTTTERNEMQSEVSSVLNEDQAQAYGGSTSVSGEFGGMNFGAGAYFDNSSSSASSNSNSQAQSYAQEVTERAMERIVKKTQVKRTSRILKEFEENNKHGFDNTKGDNHVTGVYRWVDKVYKNSLINYGKRLMYEFALPEPSKFLKKAIWKQLENEELDSGVIIPEAPVHPSDYVFANGNRVTDASELSEYNYQELAALYNADVDEIPVDEMYIGKAFSYTGNPGSGEWNENTSDSTELDIPEGYYTNWGQASWYDSADSHINNSVVFVGNRRIYTSGTGVPLQKFTGKIPLSCSQLGNLSGSVNVSIKVKRLPETKKQWQNDTYNAILEAYNERLQEYNDAQQNLEVIPTTDEVKLTFNPRHNKSLMVKELKRIAIELLTEPKDITVSKNNYSPAGSSGISKVDKDQAFQNHAAAVKFFEQAFDWEIMAYIFYPYFYAKENNWESLFQEQDAADPIYQAFLQSGMARAVVPVKPGFEDAVNWYMETGEIWNGEGLVIDQDNDLYISVAEEMQTIDGVVEDTWETRLPTALTILQAESAMLLEGGLPCYCDGYSGDNTIVSGSELLIGNDGAGIGTELLN